MTDLLNRVKSVFVASRKAERQAYTSIVEAVAAGTEPDPQAVADVLRESGKSPDEFAAAVELARQRVGWKCQYATLPALESERTGLANARQDIATKLEAEVQNLRRRAFQQIGEIDAKLTANAGEISRCHDSRVKLLESTPVEDRPQADTASLASELRRLREEQTGRRQTGTLTVERRAASERRIAELERELNRRNGAVNLLEEMLVST